MIYESDCVLRAGKQSVHDLSFPEFGSTLQVLELAGRQRSNFGQKKERTEQVRGSSLVPFLNEKGRGHRLHALEFPVLTFPSEAAVRFF